MPRKLPLKYLEKVRGRLERAAVAFGRHPDLLDRFAERIIGACAREGRDGPTRSEMRVGIIALRLLLDKDVAALLDALESPDPVG